jgi:hypothetical protein
MHLPVQESGNRVTASSHHAAADMMALRETFHMESGTM